MIMKQFSGRPRTLTLLTGVCAFLLSGAATGWASGYGHGDPHQGLSKASPHGSPHSPGDSKGYGSMHPGSKFGTPHGTAPSRHGTGHGPHQSASAFIDHILKFKQGMGITDDQAEKLRTIKTDFEKKKIKMKADIQLASLDLHELLRDDKGDLGSVESKLKSLYDLRATMYMASVKAGREAKSVLTDEQRARMKTVHERINAYKEGGMGKGHPKGYSHHSKGKES
jgi:Spy/CpxP family protein refolding chaperone